MGRKGFSEEGGSCVIGQDRDCLKCLKGSKKNWLPTCSIFRHGSKLVFGGINADLILLRPVYGVQPAFPIFVVMSLVDWKGCDAWKRAMSLGSQCAVSISWFQQVRSLRLQCFVLVTPDAVVRAYSAGHYILDSCW